LYGFVDDDLVDVVASPPHPAAPVLDDHTELGDSCGLSLASHPAPQDAERLAVPVPRPAPAARNRATVSSRC